MTCLTVLNFKKFEEVVIELDSPVLFIGPNNSGKTTALQAGPGAIVAFAGKPRQSSKRGSQGLGDGRHLGSG